MRAELLELPGKGDVVLQRIFGPRFIQNIAGIADGGLADSAGFESGVERNAHVVNGVERIENAEDIDALAMGLGDKAPDDIIRIGCIADGVCAAKEHLEANIRDALAEPPQALPGVLVEEAERGVKGGAAPHFDAE